MSRFRRFQPAAPRVIEARRAGTCTETGQAFERGARILWDAAAGVAYGPASTKLAQHEDQQRADDWNRAHGMADANW